MSLGYWEHIEPFWESVSIHDGPEKFLLNLTETPEHAAHLLALHWCASEVCNGGFHQFFFNSTGVLAPEAVTGFTAIGMPQTAAVVAAAMARLGQPYPRDRNERQEALDAADSGNPADGDWRSPFHDLDWQFYELLGREYGGMEKAAARYASQFPVPEGPLHGTGLLNRLLATLHQ